MCALLARLSALTIVALIVLPFSAPFPTCDLAKVLAQKGTPVPTPQSRTMLAAATSQMLVSARVGERLRLIASSDSERRVPAGVSATPVPQLVRPAASNPLVEPHPILRI